MTTIENSTAYTTTFGTVIRSSEQRYDRIEPAPQSQERSTTPVVAGLCVYGALLLGLGVVMCGVGMTGFGILTVGEGLFRIGTAFGVRARRQGWIVVGLVHCSLSLLAAALALPLGIVGVLANCLLIRGLSDLKD